jgi:N-acetyl-beta-hexosaminidase
MEHTFAYRGHEVVWEKASPFTGEEILALDAFCRQYHVALIPNQNSFGYMHRWLIHEPYRPLAECPDGVGHPFSPNHEPYSLCPTDPGSLALLADLYDQLLLRFSSPQLNVGLDETFDLGLGRSAQACTEKGSGRVYLEFLKQIHRLVSQRGRTMQFWGDIILHHPELIGELPQDAIALA